MYWQREKIRKAATWSVGGTYTLELPDHGLLGSIMIHAYQGAVLDSMVAIEKWRMVDYIKKIEVIGNGSEIIKSVNGRIGKYLAWLDGGGGAPDKAHNYGTSTKRHHSVINFGRKLFDPDYGLDLGRWGSVEIKLTNDAAAAQFTSAINVDVICYWLREGSPSQFKGYFRTEQWREWTTVAAEKKYLELPLQHVLRRLILQTDPDVDGSMMAETTLYNLAYNIELSIRSGKLKVFNDNLRDLWYENYFNFGRDIIQPLEPYHTQDYGIRMGIGQTLAIAGARIPHDGTQDTATPSFSPGEDSSTQKRMTDTDADQESILAMGLALENCAVIPFDQYDDPSTWLDLRADGTVQLMIETTNAASAADGNIVAVTDRLVTG